MIVVALESSSGTRIALYSGDLGNKYEKPSWISNNIPPHKSVTSLKTCPPPPNLSSLRFDPMASEIESAMAYTCNKSINPCVAISIIDYWSMGRKAEVYRGGVKPDADAAITSSVVIMEVKSSDDGSIKLDGVGSCMLYCKKT